MRCLTGEECEAWRAACSRRRQWKRQVTCHTPLDRLPWFSAMLVDHLTPYDQALLVIDQVVFGGDPPALEAVRRAAGEERPIHEAPGHLFGPDDEGITSVLKAALSEWVDFRVLLSPPRHAVRADHDEYTTFFSESAGKIAEVRRDLERERIALPEYTAKAP